LKRPAARDEEERDSGAVRAGTRGIPQLEERREEGGAAIGAVRVCAAVEEALTTGCSDAAAVRRLAEAADLAQARGALAELGELSRFERPAPVMNSSGDYIARAEPVIFMGDSAAGQTHLLTGLAVAARRPKRRVRFAAVLISEMAGAKPQLRLDLARRGGPCATGRSRRAECLLQVNAERAGKAVVAVTTKPPFQEWTPGEAQRPAPRGADRPPCRPQANLIAAGTQSRRFRRAPDQRKRKAAEAKS
jgi:hypothetical protein